MPRCLLRVAEDLQLHHILGVGRPARHTTADYTILAGSCEVLYGAGAPKFALQADIAETWMKKVLPQPLMGSLLSIFEQLCGNEGERAGEHVYNVSQSTGPLG